MKSSGIFFALFLTLTPLLADSAWAEDARLTGPTRVWTAEALATADPHRLYVKFAEGTQAEQIATDQFRSAQVELTSVNQVLAQFSVSAVSTFPYDRAKTAAWKIVGEEKAGAPGPDLSLWFTFSFEGTRPELAELLNRLNALEDVEIAHPSPRVGSASIHTPGAPVPTQAGATPDFTSFQDYLYAPPVGLNAPAIWSEAGGTGAGMHFIDVEAGWTVDHEDFNLDNFFYSGGTDEDFGIPHGTAVLGEIVGQENGFGIRGFAPDVSYGVEAIDIDAYPDVATYFQEAVDNLNPGDVWLIELQMFPDGFSATPMEFLQVNFDVIWTSVFARGIICVEAGANGSEDLDQVGYGGLFDLSLRDSGAILVGAGTPFGLVAEGFSNYGSRIDCHAWGSQIYTTGYGDLYSEGPPTTHYTSDFGGTSGASPMIVGSALCLQGVALAHFGAPLHPLQIRNLLRITGTPHQDPVRHIGRRPDLGEALSKLLASTNVPETTPRPRLVLSAGPNPIRDRTSIRFALEREQTVELIGFNAAGQRIARLFDGPLPAGQHTVDWNLGEHSIQSGVVFVRLNLDHEKQTTVALRVVR